jgi:hypothetical protein
MKSGRSTRRRAFKAAAAAGAVALALAVGEVAARIARVAPHGKAEPLYDMDPFSHHRPRPGYRSDDGVVRVNSLGYRDEEEFPREKPPGERRILFLGDSFVFGGYRPAAETFVGRCARAIAAVASGVRAINASCPEWGTRHEAAALEHHDLPLSPDVVVLCFYVGNDLFDNLSEEPYEVEVAGDGTLTLTKREQQSLRKRILAHSRLYQLYDSTAFATWLRHPFGVEDNFQRPPNSSRLREDTYYELERRDLEVCRRGAADRPPLDEAWRLTEQFLAKIATLAAGAGAKTSLVVIPDEAQVDEGLRAELARRFHLDEKDFDLDQPQRRLAEIARRLGLPLVDLLPAFREKGRKGGLYEPVDTHWNGAGQALAADLVAPGLVLLLPSR